MPMFLFGFFQLPGRKLVHDPAALFEEVVERVQAFSIEFAAEILAGGIVPLTDNGHPGDNFGVKLPSAPQVELE
jgi:hypothetical protein